MYHVLHYLELGALDVEAEVVDGGVAHGEDEGGQGQTLEPDAALPGLRDQAGHAGDDVGRLRPVKVRHRRSATRNLNAIRILLDH